MAVYFTLKGSEFDIFVQTAFAANPDHKPSIAYGSVQSVAMAVFTEFLLVVNPVHLQFSFFTPCAGVNIRTQKKLPVKPTGLTINPS